MIEVQHLSRYYGDHRAVDDVSFQIGSHTVVGFLGLNGAGKTTTLKVIAGLLPPSAGSVRVDGVDMSEAPEAARTHICFLPETPPLYTELTVREFLRFIGQLRGMSRAAVEARIPEVIALCKLEGREDWLIDELSHGYRKRVGIASSVLHRPKLLILDEPISGLDPEQIIEMRAVVRELGKSCTVLVSSHILTEVRQTCDRVLVLRKGQLVYDGDERQLRGKARGEAIRVHLIGSAAALRGVAEGLPWVSDLQIEEEAGDRVTGVLTVKDDRRHEVVAALVRAGLGVRGVEDARDPLEQIFLDLTRESR